MYLQLPVFHPYLPFQNISITSIFSTLLFKFQMLTPLLNFSTVCLVYFHLGRHIYRLSETRYANMWTLSLVKRVKKFKLMGWYKPSIMDTDGLVKEPRSVHIMD